MNPISPVAAPSASFLAIPAWSDSAVSGQLCLFCDGPREETPVTVLSATPRVTSPVRVSVDGGRAARCTNVLINGQRRTLQDRWFAILLRFVAAHVRSAGSWSSRAALGMGCARNGPTYIRQAFAGLVPAGFHVIEGDRLGNFRLHPALVVELIAWDALAQHPNPSVQATVAEQRRRDVRA